MYINGNFSLLMSLIYSYSQYLNLEWKNFGRWREFACNVRTGILQSTEDDFCNIYTSDLCFLK